MRVLTPSHIHTHTTMGEVKGTKECIRQEESCVIGVLKMYKCEDVWVHAQRYSHKLYV